MAPRRKHVDLLVIRGVERRPELYDRSAQGCNDMQQKNETWRQIAQSVNLEVDACRSRWKGLRDTFVKSRKNLQWRRDAHGQVKKVNVWAYAPDMKFLTPFLKEIHQYDDSEDSASEATPSKHDDNRKDWNLNVDKGQEAEVAHTNARYIARSTRTTADEDSPRIEADLRISDDGPHRGPANTDTAMRDASRNMFVEDMIVPRKRQRGIASWSDCADQMDSTGAFFYSMAASVRKLPLHVQSSVRLRVCQVVTEAELDFHAPTMPRNSATPARSIPTTEIMPTIYDQDVKPTVGHLNISDINQSTI